MHFKVRKGRPGYVRYSEQRGHLAVVINGYGLFGNRLTVFHRKRILKRKNAYNSTIVCQVDCSDIRPTKLIEFSKRVWRKEPLPNYLNLNDLNPQEIKKYVTNSNPD